MFQCVKTFINRMQSIKMGRKKLSKNVFCEKIHFLLSCPWLVSLINKRHLSLKSFFLEKSLKCFSNKLKLTILYLKERKHIFVLIDPQQWTREKIQFMERKTVFYLVWTWIAKLTHFIHFFSFCFWNIS